MKPCGSDARRHLLSTLAVGCALLVAPLASADDTLSEIGDPLVASAEDGRLYQVSEIVVDYAEAHPDHPPLAILRHEPIELSRADDGYVAPRGDASTVIVTLDDLAAEGPQGFYASALAAVNRGILSALNRQGLGGVTVQPNPADIDPDTGEDRRSDSQGTVRVDVMTGRIGGLRVAEVETFGFGKRLPPDESAGNPLHQRIKQNSPIQPTGSVDADSTDLLRTDLLGDYVAYLNRHPGRSVVAEVSPSRMEPGVAYLDFKIVEEKPWSTYYQGSNTGTRETQHFRQRFGFSHNQLTGNDDILRIDYVTSGTWSELQGIFGSYELPVPWVDRLRFGVNGAFSEYDASEVGSAFERFTGRQHQFGGEFSYNFFQDRELFVDLVAGGNWKNVHVENKTLGTTGEEDYWLPRVGFRAEREDERSRFFADVSIERSLGGGSSLDQEQLNNMGRVDPDDRWKTLRWYAQAKLVLDSFLARVFNVDPERQVHDLLVETKGQYAFGHRLMPQEMGIAGGLYTVRGYGQADVSGDSVAVVRSEYRFHPIRLCGVRRTPSRLPVIGEFRWLPQHARGRADWDLTLSGFFDYANVQHNDSARSASGRKLEPDHNLNGAGFGAGIQVMNRFAFQYYYGIALSTIKDGIGRDITESGDVNHHIEFTLLF